jgi:hypothetical protein
MSRSSEYLTLLDIQNKHFLSNRITGTHTHTHTLLINQAENVLYVYVMILCFVLFVRPEVLVWFLCGPF